MAEPEPAPPAMPDGWSYTPGPPSEPPDRGGIPGGHDRKGLWIAAAAVVAAAVVACVLVFAVFDEQIFSDEASSPTSTVTTGTTAGSGGSGGATSTSTAGSPGAGSAEPEQAVEAFFQAMEDKNVDAFFALLDPVAMEEFLGGLLASEEAREALAASMFDYGSIDFSDLEFTTVMKTATTAQVTVTAGTAVVTDSKGVTVTKAATEAGQPVTFELVQRDGAWYIDPGAMLGTMGGR